MTHGAEAARLDVFFRFQGMGYRAGDLRGLAVRRNDNPVEVPGGITGLHTALTGQVAICLLEAWACGVDTCCDCCVQ